MASKKTVGGVHALVALCLMLASPASAVTFPGSGRAHAEAILKKEPRAFCVALRGTRDDAKRTETLVKARILDSKMRLTDYGWGFVDMEDETCLVGGVLDVAIGSLTEVPRYGFVGTARVSAQRSKLSQWMASSADAMQLAEVQAALAGQEMTVALEKGRDGQWRLDLSAQQPMYRMVVAPEPESARKPGRPDARTVASRWLAEHGTWMFPCLHPTDERHPVDEEHFRDKDPSGAGLEFSAAIFEMLERNPVEQRVLSATLPRFQALERAGVLVSRAVIGPSFRAGKLPGRVYEVAPEYRRLWLAPPRVAGGCLSLGGTETVSVTAMKFRDERGLYRVRRVVADTALWTMNRALWKDVPELQGLVEDGRLCFGEFYFGADGVKFMTGGCQ